MSYNVFGSNKKKRKDIYQVFVNNKLTAATRERMAAIKLRNLAQDNGELAYISTTDKKHASKDCIKLLELLEDGEQTYNISKSGTNRNCRFNESQGF